MENTSENKAKFFSHHLNQKVLYQNRIGNIVQFYLSCGDFSKQVWIVSLEDENFEQNEMSCNANVLECQLLLKNLSEITDDELGNMARFYEKTATNVYIHDDQLTFDYYSGDETHSVAVELNSGYCLDFLRNKGYAMEWMGLSFTKLIEYNWIKIK